MTVSAHNVPLLAEGSVFGRYQILSLIGEGGMGAVYQAKHNELGKVVALKTLCADENQNTRARLLFEGEVAARIRHRNVVDVYDVGTFEDTVYLVMEYLEGEDLRAFLRREKTIASTRLAAMMLPLCAGLQAAHRKGVVHRDVKPSNVFLARGNYEEMTPKLLDFGVSKLVDERTRHGAFGSTSVVGTLPYMAPEQATAAGPINGRIDQYSLGVLLYRCTTGQLPFRERSLRDMVAQINQGQFPAPSTLVPDIDSRLETLIVTAMARHPGDRFDSMLEVGRHLLPLADARTQAQWTSVFRPAPPCVALGPTVAGAGTRPESSSAGSVAASSLVGVPTRARWRLPAIGLASIALAILGGLGIGTRARSWERQNVARATAIRVPSRPSDQQRRSPPVPPSERPPAARQPESGGQAATKTQAQPSSKTERGEARSPSPRAASSPNEQLGSALQPAPPQGSTVSNRLTRVATSTMTAAHAAHSDAEASTHAKRKRSAGAKSRARGKRADRAKASKHSGATNRRSAPRAKAPADRGTNGALIIP